ncbi:MAG: signal peptide peptidase SppA [Verrucomicrobiales bacterium]
MDTNPQGYHSTPPPIIVPPPPMQRRSGGKGWMFLSFILLGVLAFMFFTSLQSRMGNNDFTGRQSGIQFEEITVENPESNDKIVVIDVEGMITGMTLDRKGRTMVDSIEDQLKVAAKDPNVKAVILKVDSPGGEVLASDDISRALIQFQENYKKPVIAAMSGLAASGGYYISAPCQWIVANELTITGSIGVIMHSINYRGLMDKVGVQPQVFKSGKFKDMLSGSKRPEDVDPAEKEMVQEMIMETYNKFKDVIRNGRTVAAKKNGSEGKALAENWEEYADGRILTGRKAYDLGFVDQLGNFEIAVQSARKIAGISGNAHLIRYQEPFDLSKMFSLFGKTDAKTIKIDVGIDFPRLQAGQLYFLSNTVVE